MVQILRKPTIGSQLGEIGGSALSTGLRALAHHKMNEITHEKQSELFRKAGYHNKGTADLLSHLQRTNPQSFHHILEMLGGQSQEQPQAQEGQPVEQPKESPSFASQVGLRSSTVSPQEQKEQMQIHKEERAALNKFLAGKQKQYETKSELGDLARDTLKYFEAHKGELPTLSRLIPQKYNPLASAATRKLDALYQKIVSKVAAAEASGASSRLTNAMLKLAQESKSAIDQPIETQEALLRDLIKVGDEADAERKLMLDIKKQNGGKYPHDLADILAERELGASSQQAAQKESSQLPEGLPDASKFKDGAILKKGNARVQKVNGQWVAL